jgi:hypothetical protein
MNLDPLPFLKKLDPLPTNGNLDPLPFLIGFMIGGMILPVIGAVVFYIWFLP